MKRARAWRNSGRYLTRDVRVAFGLEHPDAAEHEAAARREASRERKLIAEEARLERLAIQEEAKGCETPYERSKRELARQAEARRQRGDRRGPSAGPDQEGSDGIRPVEQSGAERNLAVSPVGVGGPVAAAEEAPDARINKSGRPLEGATELDTTPAWGEEMPNKAQPGWYRLGRNFYRVGQGPYPDFGVRPAAEVKPPARIQMSLF